MAVEEIVRNLLLNALRFGEGQPIRVAVERVKNGARIVVVFGFSEAGYLSGLFSGWFDTTSGPKKETASYERIARALGRPAEEILFLSDVRAELDAARAAGLRTAWLVREGALPGEPAPHPVARTFDEVRIS